MADPLSVRRRFGRQLRVALWLSALCLPGPVHAGHLPLWELGIGIGTLHTPHYRGSDSEADLLLPFPYVIYRGSFLQIDREEGVRGKLFNNKAVRIDLSLAGNVPGVFGGLLGAADELLGFFGGLLCG